MTNALLLRVRGFTAFDGVCPGDVVRFHHENAAESRSHLTSVEKMFLNARLWTAQRAES